mmetsp:Transcript_71756/g.201359  ORF Transcript_71756/g.201359 Transcript_71756/m.201359 type:complete len:216 (-) Transcript_71756:56-703(-)
MGAYQGCGASQCCSSGRGRCMCGEDGPSESKVIGMSALMGEGCDAEMVEVVDMAPVDEEKRRLEMVVAIFIREALQGRPITLLAERAQNDKQRVPAVLRLRDPDWDQIFIRSTGVSIDMPVGDISEVYTIVDDGLAVFPTAVVSGLSEAERPRALRLVHRGQDGELRSFCFLEASAASRKSFLTTLQYLCAKKSRKSRASETCPNSPHQGEPSTA